MTARDEWMAGAAWVLRTLSEEFGHSTIAAMIADEGGYTVVDFEASGIDASDIDAFRAKLNEITKRRKRQARHSPAPTAAGGE